MRHEYNNTEGTIIILTLNEFNDLYSFIDPYVAKSDGFVTKIEFLESLLALKDIEPPQLND